MNRPDDEIFSDALDLPLAERAAFLDRVCADDAAQRARVDALLAAADAATARDFLDQPVAPRPDSPEEKLGDQIGAYTLVRRIGEGGCGVVYLAEQTAPIRRQVALKVIKLGMDTREVIARFEAERQALALMDHPGIARVFDAGATATGRPFFVMEFVDGLPITRFCDEHRLTTEQRLDLFARVCLAIQHAHQKGVIHRDVKPSNILVALHDGVPTPKVIDFGIAKATEGRLAHHTLVTQLDQLVGTPAYMSPEQVDLRALDIDTRSDVYSLGVLLYELLTGRPPYDPRSLVQAGLAEIRRIIREVDPPRPSARFTTLAAADRATVARLHGAAPVQLTSVLRGDLDWIVMRCLEKDRARRYGTASELAEDVRRHLRHETVAARPPDALYRARKFVSRHRLAVGATVAVALSLIAGTVVSLVQADRARRAETLARAERDAAQTAQRAEAAARADAQRRQEQAESLLTFMLGDFRAELKKIGKLGLLDAVGDKAMAHFAALDPKDLTDAALNQHARALTQIGEIRLDQARYADASKAFETAYERTAALCTRHPQNADMLFERAQAEFWIGFTARRRGDVVHAREWLTRYRDTAVELAKFDSDRLRALREQMAGEHNLAVLDFDEGNLAAAERGFLAKRATMQLLLPQAPSDTRLKLSIADIESWRARVAEAEGRFADALACYEATASGLRELAQLEPTNPLWKARLADNRIFVAHVLVAEGRTTEALASFESAGETYVELTLRDPNNQQRRVTAVTIEQNRALLLFLLGRTREARETLMDALKQSEALAKLEPASLLFRRRLAAAHRLQARFDYPDSATAYLEASQAVALSGDFVGEDADGYTLSEFALSRLLAGRLARSLGREPEARQLWQQVIARLAPQLEKYPRSPRVLAPLAEAHRLLGDTNSAQPLIEMLKACGYHAVDPLTASLFEAAP